MSELLKFQTVEEPDEPAKPAGGIASDLLILALRELSKRTVVALASLFTLATVGSAWWLWVSIPDPNPLQLVGLATYAVFVLLANWIVRR